MPNAPRRVLTIALVLALAWALQPASAADVKLTLWRLKTYIPPYVRRHVDEVHGGHREQDPA